MENLLLREKSLVLPIDLPYLYNAKISHQQQTKISPLPFIDSSENSLVILTA
jgi:hypothetical protein